jgi:LCP family protein required for cell wall assembly
MNNEEAIKEYEESGDIVHAEDARQEDYVTNYLIFGIEEFGGARNTDSMMIATVNTKDDTLKLTSLLRDSYVDIPDHNSNKLNSAYSRGGARMLVDTIELNYKIRIDGYASVDFKSFEKIVDLIGGVTIELGKEEAQYLNTTNYISKKKYRNVKPGINHLNGNQVMGYVRVRKVKTLGGVNNDYGRIVRQQRALKAIFASVKSPKNLINILSITKESLSYVTTNLTQKQIEQAMADVVENRMKSLDTFRIPVDGAFDSPKKYNGVTYPIVLDWNINRIELYKFIYGDTEKEAITALK